MWYNMDNSWGENCLILHHIIIHPNKQTKANKQLNERETNMKIKNLAFCGVMASILGVGAASADTVIASKAYVDAQTAPKQLTSNIETVGYTSSTNQTSTTKYPSMATLKDAYDTLDTAISDASTAIGTNAWTGNALDTTAEGYNNAKLMKVQSLANTAQRATDLGENGTVAANVTKWNASTADDNTLPTTKAVAQQLEKIDTDAADSNVLALTGDNVHKLAKAEAIQAAADTTSSVTYTAADGNTPSSLTVKTSGTAGNESTKLATTSQVASTADAIKSYVDSHTSGTVDNLDYTDSGSANVPVTNVAETNGVISVTHSTITYEDGMNNTLKSINDATTNASCSASDPCMLTYIGEVNGTPHFRWTNLATENLTADTTGASQGA